MAQILDRKTAPQSHALEKIHIAQAENQKLDNGVPISIVNAGTQDLVKVEFVFNAGVWQQSVLLQASCTNSMLDEGTKTRKASQIADDVDYYGAYLEQEANQDWASVVLYTLNKHLASVLPVLEDILKNPVFPQNELNILLQNKRQGFLVDDQKVAHVARTRFSSLIFGKECPYTYKLTIEDFDKLKRDHLVDFYNKFYKSNHCNIVVSGKVNSDTVKLINKHFGGKDWGAEATIPVVNSSVIVSDSQNKHLILREDAVQSAIRIGRILFNKLHPDYHAMKVLNTVLGGYFGSRLMANIREDKGYTYGIGSRIVSLRNAGYFFISTEVGVDVCKPAIKEIYTEVKRLRDDLVTDGELDLVKSYMLGDFVRSVDGPFALAEKFKKIKLYNLGYDYYDTFVDTVKSVTSAQLRELANKYLSEDHLHELVVGKMQ
jgi:zinc protease